MADPFGFREYQKFLKSEKRASLVRLVALAIGGFSLAVIVGISAIWVYNRSWTSDVATSPQVPNDSFASEVAVSVPVPGQSVTNDVATSDQVSNHSSPSEVMTPAQVSFSMCSMTKRNNCVVDGDTIWMAGRKIRIADIDAPEKSDPKCDSEYELALQATSRLLELVNQGSIVLRPIGSRDQDQYGRDLRIVLLEGQSVGDILVSEGLARTWTGRREPWC
jgi:micrococcal nuclease